MLSKNSTIESTSAKKAIQLSLFIVENDIEYHWYNEDVLLFLSMSIADEFKEMMARFLNFDDNGIKVTWKGNYIVLEMRDILGYSGMDEYIKEIFPIKEF